MGREAGREDRVPGPRNSADCAVPDRGGDRLVLRPYSLSFGGDQFLVPERALGRAGLYDVPRRAAACGGKALAGEPGGGAAQAFANDRHGFIRPSDQRGGRAGGDAGLAIVALGRRSRRSAIALAARLDRSRQHGGADLRVPRRRRARLGRGRRHHAGTQGSSRISAAHARRPSLARRALVRPAYCRRALRLPDRERPGRAERQ